MKYDFTYKNINFYLNKNTARNEYESKYHCLYEYAPDTWHYLFGCDTKREAIERVHEAYKRKFHPYV